MILVIPFEGSLSVGGNIYKIKGWMNMEREIGEIFEYDGEWYQCVKSDGTCNGCVGKFQPYSFCNGFGECVGKIFKKLEKVGGTLGINKKTYQCIKPIYHKGCIGCVFEKSCRHICRGLGIYVEIKQNKEDMEENNLKHSNFCKIGKNLRPFNLEEAKAGKPVCTMDGRKARIICFDRRLFYKNVSYPILALVECSDGEDDVCAYNEKGKVLIKVGAEYKEDLMMLPEKKEGWVNVYQGRKLDADYLYPSKEDAVENIFQPMKDKYIDTIKIEWKE